MREPIFTDVLHARRTLRGYLQPTPLRSYPGRTVVLVVTGGNISPEQLKRCLG